METTQCSPHVMNYVSSGSGLVTQLRKVMCRIESLSKARQPIPVKLSKRAEVLIHTVSSWASDSCVSKDDPSDSCPLRYKKTRRPDPSSQSAQSTQSSNTTTTRTPDSSTSSVSSVSPPRRNGFDSKKSSSSVTRAFRTKYNKTWQNTQSRQRYVINSFD